MTDHLEKPSIDLSEICERDALTYRVGNYFETFSNVEQHLSYLVGRLLNITPARIQFLWKDSFTDQKIKTLRRAAIATLGPEHSFWLELRPILNELATAVEFRNRLAHGLVITEHGETKHGKPGASPYLQYQDFEKIDETDVQAEVEKLSRIGVALMKAQAELA
jgi:hypothetical protein